MSVINDALRRLERAERGDARPPADAGAAAGPGASAVKRPAWLVAAVLVVCVAGVAWWQWPGRPGQGRQHQPGTPIEVADADSPPLDRPVTRAASPAPMSPTAAPFMQAARAQEASDAQPLANGSVAQLTGDAANEGVARVTSLASENDALPVSESASPTEVGVLTATAPVERAPAEGVTDQDVAILTAQEKPAMAERSAGPTVVQPAGRGDEAAAVAALTGEPASPVADGESVVSAGKRPSAHAVPADAATQADADVATLTASPAPAGPGHEPLAQVPGDDDGLAVSSLTGSSGEKTLTKPAAGETSAKGMEAAGQAPEAPAAPVTPAAARHRTRSDAPRALDDVRRLARLGRYAQALQLARSLPKPRNRQERLQRAGLLLPIAAQAGDCALALSSADQLPAARRTGDQWFWLGYCHLQQADYPQAVQDFRAATGGPVQRARNWLYLGIALQQVDQHADAIDAFHQARTLDASLPEIAFNAGLSYLALGDGARARAAFVHFLEATDAQAVRYAAQRARVKSLLASN